MPRNGSGSYSLPTNSWFPAVNGVTALSTDWNNTAQDIQAALSQSVSSDGQTPMTGNLPMGNNKITGLADGSANSDAVSVSQLATKVSKAGDTMTGPLTLSEGGVASKEVVLAPTAYVGSGPAGSKFEAQLSNTTTITLADLAEVRIDASGLLIVNSHSSGDVGFFRIGGGATDLISGSTSYFASTAAASRFCVWWYSGGPYYSVKNQLGSPVTVSLIFIKTRDNT